MGSVLVCQVQVMMSIVSSPPPLVLLVHYYSCRRDNVVLEWYFYCCIFHSRLQHSIFDSGWSSFRTCQLSHLVRILVVFYCDAFCTKTKSKTSTILYREWDVLWICINIYLLLVARFWWNIIIIIIFLLLWFDLVVYDVLNAWEMAWLVEKNGLHQPYCLIKPIMIFFALF